MSKKYIYSTIGLGIMNDMQICLKRYDIAVVLSRIQKRKNLQMFSFLQHEFTMILVQCYFKNFTK